MAGTDLSGRKYKAYPEYQNSDIDWLRKIPNYWQTIPLRLILNTRKGVAFKSNDFTSVGIRVVKASDIKKLTINSSEVYLPTNYISIYPKAILRKGDIILSTVGSNPNVKNSAVGQIGIVPEHLDGALLNQNTVVFEPKEDKIHREFLFKVIQMNGYRDHLDLNAHGTANQSSLSISDMLNFYIPIPPNNEQQKIASFLDHETAKIDTLIAKQEKLIELLKEKRQAVISHAVTKGLNPNAPMRDSGVEWLGEVPEHWSVGRYKFCNDRIIVGIAEAATHAYAEDGVPLIRSTNIKDDCELSGEFLYLKEEFAASNATKMLFENDVVTVRTGYPGVSAVVPKELNKSQCFTNLVATPNKNSEPYFLSNFLNSHLGKSYFALQGWGSAQQNISVPILENTPIALPPQQEQIELCNFIREARKKYNNLVGKAELSIRLMKERKTALISAAVTGKIDVRDFVSEQGQPQGV